ncbi:MAG: hypothetical protein ACPG4X_18610 [Pikeienuella sp.]
MKHTLKTEWRYFTNCLAALFVFTVFVDQSYRVVWFMTPRDWCVAPNYVEARFYGYKWLDWKPVRDSFAGEIKRGGKPTDAAFDFIDDPTPGSSKPVGLRDFGVWRWWGVDIEQVRMSMEHQTLNPQEGRTNVVQSVYGFFKVPETAPACSQAAKSQK